MKINYLKISAFLLAGMIGLATSAHADYRRICRGGDLPSYRIELRKAVKAKLDAASIAYKSVNVVYTNIRRDHDTFSPDFTSAIELSGGPVQTATFVGTFPDLTPCEIQAKIKIIIRYDNGTAITSTSVTIPGTMLLRAPLKKDGNLKGAPGVD